MNDPKVSVITVCYNAVNTIEKTIRSVSDQTYTNIEYIIIDGGSDDETIDVLKRYENSGVIDHWISEQDEGISDAFNKGIKNATGDYIQIVNADDWLYPRQLEIAASYLSEHPEVGFVYGDVDIYDQGGSKVKRTKQGLPEEVNESVLPRMKYLSHSTFMVRRCTYEKVGLYDRAYDICMDLDWVIRARKANVEGKYIQNLTGVMRDGGVSSKEDIKLWQEKKEILLKHDMPILPTWIHLLSHLSKLFISRKILEPLGLRKR
jgi:glycosyltransferase involved in cell wall biosynthesis